MHNKFCVIDRALVITGSYNWTNKANNDNYENITITTGDPFFALQFVQEFNRITEKHFAEKQEEVTDFSQIVKRLELIGQLIELGDTDDLPPQYRKLKTLVLPDDVRSILDLLDAKRFSEAVVCLSNFVARFKQLTIYNDAEIAALKLEIQVLEVQFASIINEISDIEKQLQDFSIRHHRELGDIIKRILVLRKEKLKDNPDKQTESEYAEKDFEDFNTEYNIIDKKKLADLSLDEQKELKQKFRKAANLCHPDKVAEEQQAQAAQIFQDLREAYEQNNLVAVNKILTQLEQGQYFSSRSERITEKTKLKSLLDQLRRHFQGHLTNLDKLKKSEAYITIIAIPDWEIYFDTTKKQLEQQLITLEKA